MTIPGSAGVSASGAATYNIPIALPPGTAGMTPTLAFDYNSQGGNGLLGMGWSLSGLSAVGRCPATQAQDGVRGAVNDDGNDRFCLDGQRLVAISGARGADGAEYRTEIDTFSKIISHGSAGTGPAWFEVRTKSGQVMEFGNTSDSRILAQGKPTARSWALNKISDTRGNYLAVTYVNDNANGQAYPSRIDYTGNAAAGMAPNNSVQFVYAARPDVAPAYQAGSLMQATVRLTNVRTYAGSALVSDYRLAYQQAPTSNRSEVASVVVCAGDGNCLPATTVQWAGGGNGSFAASAFPHPNGWNYGSPPSAGYMPMSGDFNGDGRGDFLMLGADGLAVFLSKGDGSFTASAFPHPNGWNYGTPPTAVFASLTGDFNGDGNSDFLMIAADGIATFLSKGDGSFTASAFPHPNGWNYESPPTAKYAPLSGDFNGDGKSDFLMLAADGIATFLSNGDGSFTASAFPHPNGWNYGSPPTAGYTPLSGDFNGDGKTDFLMIAADGIATFLSNGDGSFTASAFPHPNGWSYGSPPSANYAPVSGDFNGDGKSDFLMIAADRITVFLSKGDGSFIASASPHPNGWNYESPPTAKYVPLSGDFNGDGKSDFLMLAADGIAVFLSKGDGTFAASAFPHPNGWNYGNPPSAGYVALSGDFNGDGKGDFQVIAADGIAVFLSNGSVGDVVASIATGLSASTSFTYAPLTSQSVYSKDTTATYPVQDMQNPLLVVSRMDVPNGAGGVYGSSYSYAGAKVDLNGRGFLGFRQMTIKDLQTGIAQTSAYRQDFPFVGLAASSTKTLGSLTLNQTANSYQFVNRNNAASLGVGSAPYRASLSQNVTTGRDLDGTALPSVTTTYQYDAFGNATQVVALTSDGFSKTATNTYSNDTTLWLLGRLTRASVTSVAP